MRGPERRFSYPLPTILLTHCVMTLSAGQTAQDARRSRQPGYGIEAFISCWVATAMRRVARTGTLGAADVPLALSTLNARRNQPFRVSRSAHDSISSRDLLSTSMPSDLPRKLEVASLRPGQWLHLAGGELPHPVLVNVLIRVIRGSLRRTACPHIGQGKYMARTGSP